MFFEDRALWFLFLPRKVNVFTIFSVRIKKSKKARTFSVLVFFDGVFPASVDICTALELAVFLYFEIFSLFLKPHEAFASLPEP